MTLAPKHLPAPPFSPGVSGVLLADDPLVLGEAGGGTFSSFEVKLSSRLLQQIGTSPF
jgi:hypothetical protein